MEYVVNDHSPIPGSQFSTQQDMQSVSASTECRGSAGPVTEERRVEGGRKVGGVSYVSDPNIDTWLSHKLTDRLKNRWSDKLVKEREKCHHIEEK